jgi:hypothetical protein
LIISDMPNHSPFVLPVQKVLFISLQISPEKLTSFHIREHSFLLVILFEATTENVHDVAMKLLVRLYYAS